MGFDHNYITIMVDTKGADIGMKLVGRVRGTYNNPPVKTAEEGLELLSGTRRILDLKVSYLIVGYEVGESGTPHRQFYIELGTRVRFKRLLGVKGVHWTLATGTGIQNKVYCSKGGDVHEVGTLRGYKPYADEMGQQALAEETYDKILAGKVNEIDPRIKLKYMHNITKIQAAETPSQVQSLTWTTKSDCPNRWIWGKPGIGKSRLARSRPNMSVYAKANNKWWDGYKNEEVVVWDDIDSQIVPMGLRRAAGDRTPFYAEVKHGSFRIRPKHVFVTSNLRMGMIYQDEQHQHQIKGLERRFVECTYEDAVIWFEILLGSLNDEKRAAQKYSYIALALYKVHNRAMIYRECTEESDLSRHAKKISYTNKIIEWVEMFYKQARLSEGPHYLSKHVRGVRGKLLPIWYGHRREDSIRSRYEPAKHFGSVFVGWEKPLFAKGPSGTFVLSSCVNQEWRNGYHRDKECFWLHDLFESGHTFPNGLGYKVVGEDGTEKE
jgi:hypothetical protein